MPNPGAVALIVAGGRGHRLGGDLPKQYAVLGGQSLLRRTATIFLRHRAIDAIQVVIHADDYELYDEAMAELDLPPPVIGGASRQESVFSGLRALESSPPDRVLIHDAARPFTPPVLIDRVLSALDDAPAAIAAVPVRDTLKRAAIDQPTIEATVARDGLWQAQTPQGFIFDAILAAHNAVVGQSLTDDAAVAERAGLTVTLVAGSEDNFKVTTADDMARAQRLVAAHPPTQTRIGSGFDVHRFATGGSHVTLCGLEIAHDHGLTGHSDADVALHAVVDALLGAIAAGDIGDHFPPGDGRWRDADSALFVDHACDLVAKAGGTIVNIDLTLICQAPRIAPHRAAMRARHASLLGIAESRISVKATTTENLGFTGRGEGIAAQASVAVEIAP
ncbi:MAG: bifunctional 2-C-methyl-D-erythritol 4-phosphate cytidylyltransferase/2-C-methyl-D-erythritol 2,4-cyclodiphosphate synthase [Alphaproteobacteria bacterium]